MNTVSDMYSTAAQLYQSGNYPQVETICHQILQRHPRHPEALHLLGVIYYHYQKYRTSIQYLRQALSLNMHNASLYLSLGNTLKAIGKIDEAIQCFRVAIKLNPQFTEAHINLGLVLQEEKQYPEALSHFQEAIRIQPHQPLGYILLGNLLQDMDKIPEAIDNYRRAESLAPAIHDPAFFVHYGNALKKQNRAEKAAQCYRKALQLQPDLAVAHNNLGSTLKMLGKAEEAIRHYQQAIQLDPKNAEAHFNLGNAFKDAEQLEAAIASYQRAIAIQPNFHQAFYNMGKALSEAGRLEDALGAYLRAVDIHPRMVAAWNNAGVMHQALGNTDAAMTAFNKALTIEPQHVEVRWNRAILNLLLGNYEQAWEDYELRWQRGNMPPRNFPRPTWDGSVIQDKTLLIYAEQGLGDTIQFIRYVPMVRQRVGKLIVECQPHLKELLSSIAGIDQVIQRGEELPPFDMQIALLSLPRIFTTTLETIPDETPYLSIPSEQVATFREAVSFPENQYNVGIVWQGNPRHPNDRNRSCPLEYFRMLSQVKHIRLYSLQKGEAEHQLNNVFSSGNIINLAPHLQDFTATAAAIQLLDVVITVDTSVAHLAGALGKPVWVLLPFAPDWRWLLNREDSPWYPTARIFRQQQRGDWAGVLQKVVQELEKITIPRYGKASQMFV